MFNRFFNVSLCVVLLCCVPRFAAATDLALPDTGVSVTNYTTALLTGIVTAVGVSIAGGFALLAIRRGIAWTRNILQQAEEQEFYDRGGFHNAEGRRVDICDSDYEAEYEREFGRN